jgi:hypothetical protein
MAGIDHLEQISADYFILIRVNPPCPCYPCTISSALSVLSVYDLFRLSRVIRVLSRSQDYTFPFDWVTRFSTLPGT